MSVRSLTVLLGNLRVGLRVMLFSTAAKATNVLNACQQKIQSTTPNALASILTFKSLDDSLAGPLATQLDTVATRHQLKPRQSDVLVKTSSPTIKCSRFPQGLLILQRNKYKFKQVRYDTFLFAVEFSLFRNFQISIYRKILLDNNVESHIKCQQLVAKAFSKRMEESTREAMTTSFRSFFVFFV